MTNIRGVCDWGLRRARWCLVGAILVGSLPGCAGMRPNEEGFRDHELPKSVRRAKDPRTDPERKIDYGTLSERAHEIERNLSP